MGARFVVLLVVLGGGGCGGVSVGGSPETGDPGGVGPAWGGAGSGGGDPAATGGAPAKECAPRDDPNELSVGDGCAELGRLAISELSLVGGADAVTPGATVALRFSMSDVSGYGFNAYPGMLLHTDSRHLVFENAADGGWHYALLACDTYSSDYVGHVSADAPRGSVVRVTARVAALNQDCPDAPAAVLELPVR
jgi:hypothetical protein